MEAQGTRAAVGDDTVVAAPGAAEQIVVRGFLVSSDTAGKFYFKDGDGTKLGIDIYAGSVPGVASPIQLKVTAGKSLVLHSDIVGNIGVHVWYEIRAA